LTLTGDDAMATFEDGERVLCYEPDPNKARVVYDAKILEVAEDEEIADGVTKKYLVHFQGWSSSWDRFVSMDFLLKVSILPSLDTLDVTSHALTQDTDENRELQRDLFEKAEECIKPAKKKKQKRKNTSEGSLSESSTVQSPSASGADLLDVSTEARSPARVDHCSGTVDREAEEDSEAAADEVPLCLPTALKRHLEHDFKQVVKRRRLNQVPADTNIVSVMESFARHYTHSKLTSHEKHFGRSPFNSHRKEKSKENFQRILDSINVCKEGGRFLLND
jgi:male-specific lethal 3